MEPLLSIIIPTYNIVERGQADDFALLIKLLGLQTLKELEVIVIDGASGDNTVPLLEQYRQRNALTYYSEPDINKFDAYNKGIKKAKGEYIAFLSCDDFIHDVIALQDIYNFLKEENADFSMSPSYCRHPEFTFLYQPSILNSFQVMPCPRQCMFFKKSVLEAENGFDTNFKYFADFDLIIRLLMKKYKPVLFNHVYLTYKIGEVIMANPELGDFDAKMLFEKNYKDLYKLDDKILYNMVKYSEFPEELLAKLSEFFKEPDRELFFERCAQMQEMRSRVNKQQEENKQ